MGKRQRRRLRERNERKQPWESQAAFENRVKHAHAGRKSK